MTYTFHSDPGHGWLAVTIYELQAAGIADKVSGFSYIDGEIVYLEEDRDAGLFIDATPDVQCVEKHINQDHWIRNLPRYTA